MTDYIYINDRKFGAIGSNRRVQTEKKLTKLAENIYVRAIDSKYWPKVYNGWIIYALDRIANWICVNSLDTRIHELRGSTVWKPRSASD